MADYSDADLLAYLDEMLAPDHASAVERSLRDSAALRQRAALLARRRDQGGHTVGEIWRRHRLSCLSRSQLGGYLLGTLEPALADYVDFHLRTVGCRLCAANLHDVEQHRRSDGATRQSRRQKIFESSAGRLTRR